MCYYRQVITSHFEALKGQGQCSSLNSYAKILEIDKSTLSRVLRGERELPLKLAHQLTNKLGLDKNNSDQFINAILNKDTQKLKKSSESVDFSYSGNLDLQRHSDVIKDHTALNILTLLSSDLPPTIDTIVEKLNLSYENAEKVLKKLFFCGLIEFRNGKFCIKEEFLSTADEITSEAIQQSHVNLLEIVKEKVKLPKEQRDFTSLKVACSLKNLNKAKKEIRKFQNRLIKILTDGEKKTDVVEIAIQLFPHSKVGF